MYENLKLIQPTPKLHLSQCDNMELLRQTPDNYYDLAIVDLPYGIGASKPSKKPEYVTQKNGSKLRVRTSNSYTPKDWDFKLSSEEYFKELFRVSKKQIVFGGNYYGLTGGYLVWDKLNGETDQFGCELAWLSFTNRTDIVRYLWSGMFQGTTANVEVHKANIQQGNKSLNEKRIHPTQKPVALYKWILDKYAKASDKILDTHLGSMSIAIACHDYSFELTGCELDEEYYHKGIKRVQTHVAQQNLFLQNPPVVQQSSLI